MRVLAVKSCHFGQISIQEDQDRRWLMIEDEIEGGAFLTPSSQDVIASCKLGPGPVSDLPYSLAWMLAGTQHPSGEALMIGLGSGSGAVTLLYNFPNIKLTVIEIEPVITELAMQYFPLVGHYISTGQLHLINADATTAILGLDKKFNFVIVDAFSGTGSLTLTQKEFYLALLQLSSDIWINYLGVLDDEMMQVLIQLFTTLGYPITLKLRPRMLSEKTIYNKHQVYNWVLGTRFPNEDQIANFQPFANLSASDELIKRIRKSFAFMVSTLGF